jgi:hypothetical protein
MTGRPRVDPRKQERQQEAVERTSTCGTERDDPVHIERHNLFNRRLIPLRDSISYNLAATSLSFSSPSSTLVYAGGHTSLFIRAHINPPSLCASVRSGFQTCLCYRMSDIADGF